MPDPISLTPEQASHPKGRLFGVPLVVVGWEALPWMYPLAALVLALLSGKRHPDWRMSRRLAAGVLSTPLVLSSEWCHNLAHTAAASAVGKPVSAIRLVGGMPRLVYFEPEGEDVSPVQHLIRTAAGPLSNALLWLIAHRLRRFAPPDSLQDEAAAHFEGVNALIGTLSLVPHPAFDGGPLLKWSLVLGGAAPAHADRVVRQANVVAGCGMLAGAALYLRLWRKDALAQRRRPT